MQAYSVRWRAAAAALLVATPLAAQPPAIGPDDSAGIQALVAAYARALAECRAGDFADLFVPETGYFASGFRGHMVGRERLVALVQSERHCAAPAGAAGAQRPGAGNVPTVTLEATANGARGVANLGTAEYQDEYTKTADGWRFASRTVIVAAEKAAGLDARELLAIHELGGSALGDYYEADQSGVDRLMTSGVRVSVSGTVVSGRAFLRDGGYNDEVYEQVGPGRWRVQSSVHVYVRAVQTRVSQPLRVCGCRRTLKDMGTTITIRTDQSLREALIKKATTEKKSVSEVVREILEDALVERPLAERVARTRGSLRLAEKRAGWQRQIRDRNWRP